MHENFFQRLGQAVKEAGAISRGEQAPACKTLLQVWHCVPYRQSRAFARFCQRMGDEVTLKQRAWDCWDIFVWSKP